jgi:hypothetical protein
MAGDWIKVESVTPDKPELVRMAELLGIDQDAVFGKVFRLWAWADQNIALADDVGNDESNDDSVTTTVTSAFVDRLTFCVGFAKAMVDVGWLVFTEGGIRLPNFKRHNGETAKTRALTARRVAKAKKKANAAGASSVTPAPLPNALPREEKRREDLKASSRTPDASARAQAVEVIDGHGAPVESVIANLTPTQSAVVVMACKALRKMGAMRWGPGDEALTALSAEGFTAEQMVRCVGEKTLRDAGLLNDPDVRDDLFEILINGGTQQDMSLTQPQYLAVRAAVTQVSGGYIAATLRGRRRSAANEDTTRHSPRKSDRKPSANDNFKGKSYAGTAINQLPAEFRDAVEQSIAAS